MKIFLSEKQHFALLKESMSYDNAVDIFKKHGISVENLSSDEIKKEYRKAAMKLHSDINGGNDKEMKELNVAYEILKDKSKKYDNDVEDYQDFKEFIWSKDAIVTIFNNRAEIHPDFSEIKKLTINNSTPDYPPYIKIEGIDNVIFDGKNPPTEHLYSQSNIIIKNVDNLSLSSWLTSKENILILNCSIKKYYNLITVNNLYILNSIMDFEAFPMYGDIDNIFLDEKTANDEKLVELQKISSKFKRFIKK